LTIETTTLPDVAKDKPFSTRLSSTGPGTPHTWSVQYGVLPPGLTLSSDGVISGTATELGQWTFDLRVTDSYGASVSATYTLQVATIVVTTSSTPDAFAGKSYSTTLQSTGGSLLKWQMASGALPPGLTLSSAGTISGTPTRAGTYNFAVVVSSGGSSSPNHWVRIVVRPMEVATTTLPDAAIWGTYSQKVTANGGKGILVWSIANGALPPGLTLNSAGTISGKPSQLGTWTVTVKVTDQSAPKQTATRTLSITVTPMSISTASLPNGVVKKYYTSGTLKTLGGKGTLTWSVAGGALPSGLKLSAGGVVSGTPTTPGSYTFTAKVADSAVPKNTATRTYTITIT
jgi:hypothetical protein